ncbi:hypothetical protein H9L17_04925 [Thermomonas brevis]|uniref:Uncharacterized protein n=1 Tax=Thermomonas brevis TaxID=215691 RepID=A0A7G9QVV9_9GAMM|nr:hypothetical protein [Thermomonas brevis]QNN47484.1 hypothetical protein H9L17_04925 [Thermomonas brevis]
MLSPPYEKLLRLVAGRGEIRAQELVAKVDRKHGNYTDFYTLAAMLHAGYITTDSTFESGGEKRRGTLGLDTQGTAVSLCQLALAKGESFTFNECARDSWHDAELKIFITSAGLLKVEELDERTENKRQKRFDYFFAIFIAILAAIAGGFATSYFTPQADIAPVTNAQSAAPSDL